MNTALITIALINLTGNLVVALAFTYMGHSQAKERETQTGERRFLMNAAMAGNSAYDFALRQQATQSEPEADNAEPQLQDIFPEGL